MPKKPLIITRLKSGGLITNYFCSSACRHCLYRCSSNWPKDYITPETAQECFQAVRKLGCNSLHIGGGEPLLRPDSLATVLEIANETGIDIEYVETNSSWYRNHDAACAMLERLAGHGLTTLLISISPFHNEYIPFYKVKGVIEACRRTGISIFPWITDFISDIERFDDKHTHSPEEYQQAYGQDYWTKLPLRYWISPGGRALETFSRFSAQYPIAELIAAGNNGCTELASVGHFHFDLYGNYIPGLCAGLSINRNDLGAPICKKDYPIISHLYENGVGGLIDYMAGRYNFSPATQTYVSKCELCYEARRFLVVDRSVGSKELQPEFHYLSV